MNHCPNNQSPKLRDAVLEDMNAVTGIYNHWILAGGATMDQEVKSPEETGHLFQSYSDRELMLVLEQGNQVIGYGTIKAYSPRAGYRFACEKSVYLAPGWTGRGLGLMMGRALLARCRSLDYHHVVGKIIATNLASIAINHKLGFEMVGRQREIGYVQGQWVDMVIMQLMLSNDPSQEDEPLPYPTGS